MAKCRRCGATFDYDKKDGVCPKCCFYNRPPGAPHHDEEWISSYNVEDNTYELPKSIVETAEEEPGSILRHIRARERRKYTSAKECHTEGSHVHTETRTSRSGTGRPASRSHARPNDSSRNRHLKKSIRVIVVCIMLAAILAVIFTGYMARKITDTDFFSKWDNSFEVKEGTADELQGGLPVGDLTFYTDDQGAVVLFNEGELPEIPAGEKCIGIHLTDNESDLNYNGIDWKRPYVFDGKYYRELVDANVMNSKRLSETLNTEFMPQFISSYNDFDGMAVYFIDKDADAVTLCIPDQSLGDDGDSVICRGAVDIELSVKEKGENK